MIYCDGEVAMPMMDHVSELIWVRSLLFPCDVVVVVVVVDI